MKQVMIHAFDSRVQASKVAAMTLNSALREDLLSKGCASLLLSGGSTPAMVYRELSRVESNWEATSIGLVDERYVPPSDPRSNERLVRDNLLIANAAKAKLVSLWSEGASLETVERRAARAYRCFIRPSAALVGMGEDGHTASWFPDSASLGRALSDQSPPVIAARATGLQPGQVERRLTVTKRVLMSTKQLVLLMFGDTKLSRFEAAMNDAYPQLPIRELVDARERKLTIIWAP